VGLLCCWERAGAGGAARRAAQDPDAGALFGVVVYRCVEDEGEVVDGRWGHGRGWRLEEEEEGWRGVLGDGMSKCLWRWDLEATEMMCLLFFR
jgi:hypothetical protein